ncbi:glutathione S-transferase C-terminal domain-containing protein [Streptomyces virginiae]|uniref:glutathione S-transferase C-terminal domain-containing protein n=1 Tax=Streptomyces virginiae TaxID=1961 RepID=UPI00369706FD
MSATYPKAVPSPSFQSRIGRDARSGFPAVPHRYRLHLTPSCPSCLRIAVTHSLLGLQDVLPMTSLPAVPDASDGGYAALRPLYEASSHLYPGPALAPVLSDGWTGRIVSTHAPDIVQDLTRRFGVCEPRLYPDGAEARIQEVERLCEQGINAAAQRAGRSGADAAERDVALATLLRGLGSLERRLACEDYLLGGRLTAADVELWVTLVQLDTVHRWHLDAAAVYRITDHPRLWSYARRLAALPAFGSHLDLDGIARRHHAQCRGREAAGAAVRIVDWAQYAPARP